MDEIVFPEVVTAIADPEFEGMISGALFADGWNVIARVLDSKSLQTFLEEFKKREILVIYSTDLPGLVPNFLQQAFNPATNFLGFVDSTGSDRNFPEISLRPNSPAELLGFIKGNIRSPHLRTPLIQSMPTVRSKIISLGSTSHHSGNTTAAINISQESALLGNSTLLVDANFDAPSIASFLEVRKLAEEINWRDYSHNFAIMEVTNSSVQSFNTLMARAIQEFDVIVLDLGSVRNFAIDLTDRRWTSIVKIWANTFSHQFCLTSMISLIPSAQQKITEQLFASRLIRANLVSLQVDSRNRKINREMQVLSPKSKVIKQIPWDSKVTDQALLARTPIASVAERTLIRKEFVSLTQYLLA